MAILHVHMGSGLWLWLTANAAPVEAISSMLSVAAVVTMGWLSWRASNQTVKEMVSQRRLGVAPCVRFITRSFDGSETMLALINASQDGCRRTPHPYIFGVTNNGAGPAIDVRVLKVNGQEPQNVKPLSIRAFSAVREIRVVDNFCMALYATYGS